MGLETEGKGINFLWSKVYRPIRGSLLHNQRRVGVGVGLAAL